MVDSYIRDDGVLMLEVQPGVYVGQVKPATTAPKKEAGTAAPKKAKAKPAASTEPKPRIAKRRT